MKTSSSQKPSTSRAASSSKIPDNTGKYVSLMEFTIFKFDNFDFYLNMTEL